VAGRPRFPPLGIRDLLCQVKSHKIFCHRAIIGKPGELEQYIPKISQETLAEMVGTTRSRVSFFMNRFRKLGFIEYNGRIKVHRSLLNVVLLDQLHVQNPGRSPHSAAAQRLSKPARRAKRERN